MHDWIVIGAGITGAALAYELAKQHSVLLLDQALQPHSATRFSYGGIAYWSGTTELTKQLCAEGIEIHRSLSAELDADTQFREVDLLLTISAQHDPAEIAENYVHFAIPPTLLTVQEACQLEPLLNADAIAGALTVKHGHIETERTTQAYIQAFERLGGELKIAQVAHLQKNSIGTITGVVTPTQTFCAKNVALCTGGVTRHFLKDVGITVKQYFTHAELIETPPVDLRLNTLVMPAAAERFALEADATRSEVEALWDTPDNEPAPAILDAGAVQFLDGRIRIGQISRTLTSENAVIDAAQSEAALRHNIGHVLPKLEGIPGKWHHCLIAFSRDRLPLIGAIPGHEGLHLFSGFSNPLAIVPPLARRFTVHVTSQRDPLLDSLSPARFT
ncbi:MAG: FAD-binding oxidoreductase [Myxacorys californica WJT36-NPBG1]|jgi:glycine/D-amino acid oxidase-like deaminating enzyme|nr:FAD-binding oxidoreductase [Myxacorys californica WJT36-NPBG1]